MIVASLELAAAPRCGLFEQDLNRGEMVCLEECGSRQIGSSDEYGRARDQLVNFLFE